MFWMVIWHIAFIVVIGVLAPDEEKEAILVERALEVLDVMLLLGILIEKMQHSGKNIIMNKRGVNVFIMCLWSLILSMSFEM